MAPHSPIRKDLSTRGPGIPDKLYFRIGEVARLCEVPAYVLRFWESEFPQLRPNKGGTGQRLFRRRDVEIALRIKGLLYNEGYTIPGARQLLRSEGKGREPQLSLVPESSPDPQAEQLRSLRQELRALLAMVSGPPPQTARAAPLRRPRLPSIPEPQSDNLFDFDRSHSTAEDVEASPNPETSTGDHQSQR